MADTSKQNHSDVAEKGLKVVTARFEKADLFSWDLFDGFDRIRVLTYSASAKTIERVLKEYPNTHFEFIFGFEEGLVVDVVKAYRILNTPAADDARQSTNERQRVIVGGMEDGRAQFYVVRETVAHAKLYLLEEDGGARYRVIEGSANFSEPAFGGKQVETLVVFDNDSQAWEHYSREYDAVKELASDELEMSNAFRARWNGDRTVIDRIRQGVMTYGMGGLWTPLNRVSVVRGTSQPLAIRFPNGEERKIDSYRGLLRNVCDWLFRTGKLSSKDLPLNGDGTGFQFINSVPWSPTGKPLNDLWQVSDGVYIATKFNAKDLTDYSKRLFTYYSVSLKDVSLRFQ